MKKLIITNLCYGTNIYHDLFLSQHLKSLLDPTNLPAFRDRVEYILFTDSDSVDHITKHPNWKRLLGTLPDGAVDIIETVPKRFEGRYDALTASFQEAVKIAIKEDKLLSCFCADLVVAKDFLPKVLSKIDAGYDSVFVLPLRSTAETMIPLLNMNAVAEPSTELFFKGYENMHHLWQACHVDTPQFTKMPFTLLWNVQLGLIAKSFSITPIVFTPSESMLAGRGMIDVDVPKHCKKPFWATDWDDAPVIGVEPFNNGWFPAFTNSPFNLAFVADWAKCLDPSQYDFLPVSLYYPNKKTVMAALDAKDQQSRADATSAQIKRGKND